MKSKILNQIKPFLTRGLAPALLATAILSLGAASSAWADGKGNRGNPGVLPPQSHPYGQSYAEWSAAWWQWAFALPVAGHPFVDSPDFNVTDGQSGPVWFLASPIGAPAVRNITIPSGKALFIGMINIEASSLEVGDFYGATAAEQAAIATSFADLIVDVDCDIDGKAVKHIERYRFLSEQFTFTAPTPWIFGDVGGTGTSVADGYYVMLPPLSRGTHTIHFSGAFDFGGGALLPLDVTYNINVTRRGHDRDEDGDCGQD